MQAIRHENLSVFLQTSDVRQLTSACFPLFTHTKMSGAHGRQELPCNSRVGMSPIGSYVGGLTSKGQVGVLLGEHRGWILRIAALIKGRLSDDSDVRPEAFAASFQTSEGEHQHAFLFPNIQHSTFPHQPKAGGFETTDCLECLQILNILYMAGRSTLKLEIGHCALY